jgi:hypothetical protein
VGLDIGRDVGSPIDFTYKVPFEFSGKIEKVTIELKPEAASKAKPKSPGEVAAVA